MVIGADGLETHPDEVSVKIKVAVPELIPVTTPLLLIVATLGFVLAHVPPVDGESAVLPPIQIEFRPFIVTTGFAYTAIGAVLADMQPVEMFVNLNVACPAANAVTTPAFVIVAMVGLLLTHVPPTVGEKDVVEPIQS